MKTLVSLGLALQPILLSIVLTPAWDDPALSFPHPLCLRRILLAHFPEQQETNPKPLPTQWPVSLISSFSHYKAKTRSLNFLKKISLESYSIASNDGAEPHVHIAEIGAPSLSPSSKITCFHFSGPKFGEKIGRVRLPPMLGCSFSLWAVLLWRNDDSDFQHRNLITQQQKLSCSLKKSIYIFTFFGRSRLQKTSSFPIQVFFLHAKDHLFYTLESSVNVSIPLKSHQARNYKSV